MSKRKRRVGSWDWIRIAGLSSFCKTCNGLPCFCEDDKDESSATFVCSGLGGGVGARLSSICAPDVYVDHQVSLWPSIHIGILLFCFFFRVPHEKTWPPNKAQAQ